MQVGCHISVALKDQLILKIVYDKEPFFVVFFGSFASKIISQVCLYKVWLFYETLQPKYGNLFGRFLFKIVDARSFIRRFSLFAKGLSQVVENSIAAALCQQLGTSLLKTALLQLCLCHNNLRKAC
jgi:hypothetical protein